MKPAMSKAWPQLTNVWREVTNPRTGSERLIVDLIWWKIPVNDIDAMRVVALRKVPPCIKREIYQARFRTNNAIRKMI
jgi:hypothetical protein